MDPTTPLQPYTPPANPPAGAAPYPQPLQAVYPMAQAPLAMPPASYPPAPPIGPSQAVYPAYPPAPPAGPIAEQQAPAPMNMGGAPGPEQDVVNVREDLITKLRTANNVLVTVSNNPSVDQLSAAIGLTLLLNKLDKHATAVYSGKTPSTIEFLQPDKTLEKNTDSLRDFIIALDKAKADKLRYKVEDKFVKIFITPYHTSLSQEDLEFSQGDFNVDVVVAIGVHKREELDEAITAHGRILHDAVTASINNKQQSDLGALNWFQPDASSLCEMLVGMIEPLQGDRALLDEQIATAFLTGVVAETERFSNEKTSPHTMNISATLMKAGANQQLVASRLNVPEAPAKDKDFDNKKMEDLAKEGTAAPIPNNDGSLAIEHKKEEVPHPAPVKTLEQLEKENKDIPEDGEEDGDLAKIHIDDEGKLVSAEEAKKVTSGPIAEQPASGGNMILQPPTLGGDLSSATRNAQSAPDVAVTESSAPPEGNGLSPHNKTIQPLTEEERSKGQTLEQIEQSVESPHLGSEPSHEDMARQAVADATNAVPSDRLEPVAALNAQPIDLQGSPAPSPAAVPTPAPTPTPIPEQDLTTEDIFPTQLIGPDKGPGPDPTAGAVDPSAPPPVPPPLVPPTL